MFRDDGRGLAHVVTRIIGKQGGTDGDDPEQPHAPIHGRIRRRQATMQISGGLVWIDFDRVDGKADVLRSQHQPVGRKVRIAQGKVRPVPNRVEVGTVRTVWLSLRGRIPLSSDRKGNY